jgi:hypothetical protein
MVGMDVNPYESPQTADVSPTQRRLPTLLKNPTFRFTVRAFAVVVLGTPLLAILIMHYQWGRAARAAFERVKRENAARNAAVDPPKPQK